MNWWDRWRKDAISTSPEGDASKDRRRTPRIPLRQSVTVRFTAHGHYEFSCISRDLSNSGIFLYADLEIEVGEQVDVILTIPSETSEPVPVEIHGKVVRIEKNQSTGIAIAFESLVIAPERSNK